MFPNHAPNPENKEAMRAGVEAVKQSGSDLGIVVDTVSGHHGFSCVLDCSLGFKLSPNGNHLSLLFQPPRLLLCPGLFAWLGNLPNGNHLSLNFLPLAWGPQAQRLQGSRYDLSVKPSNLHCQACELCSESQHPAHVTAARSFTPHRGPTSEPLWL